MRIEVASLASTPVSVSSLVSLSDSPTALLPLIRWTERLCGKIRSEGSTKCLVDQKRWQSLKKYNAMSNMMGKILTLNQQNLVVVNFGPHFFCQNRWSLYFGSKVWWWWWGSGERGVNMSQIAFTHYLKVFNLLPILGPIFLTQSFTGYCI